jgi:hypothetical protein
MSKHDWQVIEDNGGGLHLFVFHAGENVPVYGTCNMEYLSSEDFASTIERIEAPDFDLSETQDWSSNYDDPQTAYSDLTASEFGWNSIAVFEDGERRLHRERMGEAGKRAVIRLLADDIYRAAYPTVDDRDFHSSTVTRIEDWLREGEFPVEESIATLSAEWLEYDTVAISRVAVHLSNVGDDGWGDTEGVDFEDIHAAYEKAASALEAERWPGAEIEVDVDYNQSTRPIEAWAELHDQYGDRIEEDLGESFAEQVWDRFLADWGKN